MSARQAGIAAWTACGVTLLWLAGAVILSALTSADHLPDDLRPRPTWFVTPAYLVGLAVVGAFIASRRHRNPIGWLICVSAVLGGLVEFGRSYAEFSLASEHPGYAGVEWLAWLASWIWLPWLMLQTVYLPVLFPEGRVPSKRWAWLLWIASITALVSVVSQALDPTLLAAVKLRNPTAVPDPSGYLPWLAGMAALVLIVLGLASLTSVFLRLKSATGDRRQQLKWFAVAVTILVTLVAAQTINEVFLESSSLPWLEALISVAYLTIPVSIGLSVLRYRLYDIDLVINRTLVYGALATFISAVYLLAVVGVGALLGLGSHVDLLLSLLAAGGVALAFQPARDRLQRLANRVVYGRRATPYDALAVLSRRVAETAPGELFLDDMGRAACEALGASSASFWLHAGQELRVVGVWPPDTRHETPNLAYAARPGAWTLPVRYEGALLGAVSVTVPPGRSLSPADRRLLIDVANQAGLLFRNLGLTADLMARVGELHESRRRLVTAQEEERRRLERNLHDGAQQQLFGLKVTIQDVRALLRRNPVAAGVALERLEREVDEALQTVRELARGVYPPLLTARGLAAALNARARSCPLDVRVSTEGTGRYPADLEGAVYFCCSEALQNAVRHAQATTVRIRLAQDADQLIFVVHDDGRGFKVDSASEGAGLQSMRDRVDVVRGTLEIVSEPDLGTTVRGRVPAATPEPGLYEPPAPQAGGARGAGVVNHLERAEG